MRIPKVVKKENLPKIISQLSPKDAQIFRSVLVYENSWDMILKMLDVLRKGEELSSLRSEIIKYLGEHRPIVCLADLNKAAAKGDGDTLKNISFQPISLNIVDAVFVFTKNEYAAKKSEETLEKLLFDVTGRMAKVTVSKKEGVRIYAKCLLTDGTEKRYDDQFFEVISAVNLMPEECRPSLDELDEMLSKFVHMEAKPAIDPLVTEFVMNLFNSGDRIRVSKNGENALSLKVSGGINISDFEDYFFGYSVVIGANDTINLQKIDVTAEDIAEKTDERDFISTLLDI